MKSGLKVKRMQKKGEKSREKKLFSFSTFTQEGKISMIKKACFMLNFLNLKSFPSCLEKKGSKNEHDT